MEGYGFDIAWSFLRSNDLEFTIKILTISLIFLGFLSLWYCRDFYCNEYSI